MSSELADCSQLHSDLRQRAPRRKWEADDYLLVFTAKLLFRQMPDVVLVPQAICYNIHKQLARGRMRAGDRLGKSLAFSKHVSPPSKCIIFFFFFKEISSPV